jgi:hypothetical protein
MLQLTQLCLLTFVALPPAPVTIRCQDITEKGKNLAAFLDRLDVEHKWLSGRYVNWETGEALDKPVTDGGPHTHCSAFTAAACRRLGIYILRPPEHSAEQLANAQFDWLPDEGKKEGWKRVAGPLDAQSLANRGYIVVAVCKEKERSGHIAIIRPSSKSAEEIEKEGPQIVQAGGTNYNSAALLRGFGNHRNAWTEKRITYYSHEIAKDRQPASP